MYHGTKTLTTSHFSNLCSILTSIFNHLLYWGNITYILVNFVKNYCKQVV